MWNHFERVRSLRFVSSEIFACAALTDVKVWVLDRQMFQAIMMKTGLQRREENIRFLKRWGRCLQVRLISWLVGWLIGWLAARLLDFFVVCSVVFGWFSKGVQINRILTLKWVLSFVFFCLFFEGEGGWGYSWGGKTLGKSLGTILQLRRLSVHRFSQSGVYGERNISYCASRLYAHTFLSSSVHCLHWQWNWQTLPKVMGHIRCTQTQTHGHR